MFIIGIQDAYQEEYDGYISKAISDKLLQTKQGNPKIPSYVTLLNGPKNRNFEFGKLIWWNMFP